MMTDILLQVNAEALATVGWEMILANACCLILVMQLIYDPGALCNPVAGHIQGTERLANSWRTTDDHHFLHMCT